MESSQIEASRAKLNQLYKYLGALNEMRNPVITEIDDYSWVLWLEELPDYPSIHHGLIYVSQNEDDERQGDNFILRVRRPDLTKTPPPPEIIKEWILDGWNRFGGKVEVLPAMNVEDEKGSLRTISFEDDLQRIEALKSWNEEIAKWTKAEKPARDAQLIYNKLYDVWATTQRESERYEFVLGDGLLSWQSGIQNVEHPILLQRVSLRFDTKADIPEFIIEETEQASEIYTSLLRVIPEVQGLAVGYILEDLKSGGWHPLGGEETESFLKRSIRWICDDGEYLAQDEKRPRGKTPAIKRAPVLYLRKRDQGFGSAIESIIDDINIANDIQPFLANIVGVYQHVVQGSVASSRGYVIDDEDILLTKEANPEQLQLVRQLETHGAVLVQGPPGTGKTHTIANLLGHLLAKGKSVLVTSHTTKALKVLRDKVVEPLRPLCVSVIDEGGHNQIESTINGITEKLSILNSELLEKEADKFRVKRKSIINQLRDSREQLLNARRDEYRAIVISGTEYSPSEAARIVKLGIGKHDWIPGPIVLGSTLPLSAVELASLYQTNGIISLDEEAEIYSMDISPKNILAPTDFKERVKECKRLEFEAGYRKEYWQNVVQEQLDRTLEPLLERITVTATELKDLPQWEMVVMSDGQLGGAHRVAWENLLSITQEAYKQYIETKEILFDHDPVLADSVYPEKIEQVLEEICSHLHQKKEIGRFTLLIKREWNTVVENARVNGKKPTELQHFSALLSLVKIKVQRKRLIDRWSAQVTTIGGPKLASISSPEFVCFQLGDTIERRLNWFTQTWLTIQRELQKNGLIWEKIVDNTPREFGECADVIRLRKVLEQLPRIIRAQINRLKLVQTKKAISNTIETLDSNGGRIARQLIANIRHEDFESYSENFDRMVEFYKRKEDLVLRDMLLAKLEAYAPGWAACIRNRDGLHGGTQLPDDVVKAWEWRHLFEELETRRTTSMEEIQGRIERLSSELREVTGSLVERRAWAAQVRRTGTFEQQALQGWKQLIKRAGKRKGVRAPWLLAKARELMPVCQAAVPVWIMPLSRVANTLDPRKNKFDVVIIDEASQADAMALIALYLGKQVVIVGDNEQVSPLAIGQKPQEAQKLIEQFLKGIPNAELYDGQFSIYDLGLTTFKPVCLQEHFRCLPSIIAFSNELSYLGRIKPLRDSSNILIIPPTVAYRVEGLMSKGKVNEKEGLAITSLLLACTEQPEYEGATFGVISLIDDEQAHYIDTLLRRYMTESEYQSREILCGNSAQFQGDERDVMFLSVVSSPSAEGPLRLLSEGPQDMYKKRFNVAASRASDQMWVVHSVDSEVDLKDGDLRRRLIIHAKNPTELQKLIETQQARAESEFERLVIQHLVSKGYRLRPQWQVGAYRIDIVVEGAGKRLAVECDGDRYHTMDDIERDMQRQAILERLGWRFVRIRGSLFFRDPDMAMDSVYRKLESLDIPPEGIESSTQPEINELQQRIFRRAEEIRRQWSQVQDDSFDGVEKKTSGPNDNSLDTRENTKERRTSQTDSTSQKPKLTSQSNSHQTKKRKAGSLDTTVYEQGQLTFLNSGPTIVESRIPTRMSIDEIIRLIQQRGIELVDKRPSGGALWVIGGAELSPMMDEISFQGINFSFAENGGKATKKQSAWYIKD